VAERNVRARGQRARTDHRVRRGGVAAVLDLEADLERTADELGELGLRTRRLERSLSGGVMQAIARAGLDDADGGLGDWRRRLLGAGGHGRDSSNVAGAWSALAVKENSFDWPGSRVPASKLKPLLWPASVVRPAGKAVADLHGGQAAAARVA
jgi:hypothetical protein